MGRIPVTCKKCGTYLSGKARKNYDNEEVDKAERGICNGCQGIGYSPGKQGGRKILWKKKK